MKSKREKIYLYIFASLLVLTLSIGKVNALEYTNYYEITMNEQEYDNLVNLGFTENEIYYMDEETFELNKDIESTLEVVDQKYYKTVYTDLNGEPYSTEISKEEYENGSSVSVFGTVTTNYRTLVTTMSQGTDLFRYKVSVAWTNFPSMRSYDIIGIGFDDDVYISSSVYFVYNYCDPNDDCTTSTAYYDRQKLSTGGSIVYKVPSGDIRSLTSVLYYDVKKNTTDTITELTMYGDYAHALEAVTSTNYRDYTINFTGIQLFANAISYYDEVPCAESYWSGTW